MMHRTVAPTCDDDLSGLVTDSRDPHQHAQHCSSARVANPYYATTHTVFTTPVADPGM